jgi:hypothetical protein
MLLISCGSDSIKPDENGFLDQVAQGKIDDERWVHDGGFAKFYLDKRSSDRPVTVVFLTVNASNNPCQINNLQDQFDDLKEFFVHFSIDNTAGLRDLYLDGFGSSFQLGIINATNKFSATTLLNIGKIDITKITADRVSGRIHGSNTTFTDTYVNGNFTVPYCTDTLKSD